MADFQIVAAVLFVIALAIFVYIKRKNLETKQVIPYFIYFSMYKTKLGLSLMDSISKKYRKIVMSLGYFGILVGFIGMAIIFYALINNLYTLFTEPEATSGVGLVLPFKGKGIFYVPFFYWIISIFVIAVVHEFSHGLIARAHNLKVKSSGFAFLAIVIPVIPAAFVEPDEKALRKRPHKEQLSIFAAGPLANIVTAFFCLGLSVFILSPIADNMMEYSGVEITGFIEGNYPAQASGIEKGEIVKSINGKKIETLDDFSGILKEKKPGDAIRLETDKDSYNIKLGK